MGWVMQDLDCYLSFGQDRGREGNKECELCGNECDSVIHVLWECSAYSSGRADLLKLQEKLGNGFECLDSLVYLRQRVVGRATGDLEDFTGIERQSGKSMCEGGKPDTGGFHSPYIGMTVCGSAYENGCVVDAMCSTAAD